LKVPPGTTSKLMAEFVCAKETPAEIAKLIKQEAVRAEVTKLGFSVLGRVFS
jgi:hypothetical protein